MKKIVLLVCLLTIQYLLSAQTIKFVTANGNGKKDGSSWANAFPGTSLQNAINTLSDAGGGQVWVAAGTYYPTQDTLKNSNPTDERAKTFALRNKVAVYGGFAGTESSINARSKSDKNADNKISAWEFTNETVLSGNINQDADSSNNVYHVVFQKRKNVEGILLDGCTVQDGDAVVLYWDSSHSYQTGNETLETNIGGGLFVSNTTVRNCIIKKNTALAHGAGIFLARGCVDSCYIANNSFISLSGNLGTGYGAGIAINEIGTLSNSVIEKNKGIHGAGIHLNAGGLVQSCSIINNKGSLTLETSHGGSLINCNIVNNVGGINFAQASVVSCTIKNNNSIQFWDSPVLNSIIVDKISLAGTVSFKYSMITPVAKDKDSLTNIYLNKLDQFGFVDTIDYKLKGTSPAINTGMPNVGTLNQVMVDLYGNPRISYERIDIGSHEYYSRRYVTQTGAGNLSGISWENALPASKLEDAVDIGTGEVWIAGGTYYVGQNPLQLTDKIRIIGGFNAMKKETLIDQREKKDIDANGIIDNWEFANATIIKPNPNISDRYGRLIDGWFVGGYPIIDGITLRDTKQWEDMGDYFSGGAISLSAGCIKNSVICNNEGNVEDPNHSSCVTLRGTAQIDHCLIKDNENNGYAGGGLDLTDKSIATFCVIRNNKTTRIGGAEGGGVMMSEYAILGESLVFNNYNNGDSPTGDQYAGGVSLWGGTIRNCIIANNTTYGPATRGGGVFVQEKSNSKIINSIIVNNSAEGDDADGQDIGVSMNVAMSNTVMSSQPFFRALTTENKITYCAMPNVLTGYGIDSIFSYKDNAELFAQFVSPTNFKGIAKTNADSLAIKAANWHLSANSWFINKGIIDNSIIQTPEIDADSTARVKHSKIDLGAYEYLISQPSTGKILSTTSLVTNSNNTITEKIQLNWSSVPTKRYLLFVKEGLTGSLNAINGTEYHANTSFGKGSLLDGWYCVYNGNSNSVTIDGLLQGTNYKAMLVTANGSNYLVYNDSAIDNVTIKPFITKREQTIQLTMPDTIQGVTDLIANVSTTSGLSVQLSTLATDIVSIQGTKITILKEGTAIIKAEQSGNNLFFPATVQDTIVVKKATQAITFSLKKTATFGDADFSLNATTSSGLPIQYTTSDNNIATISNGWISIKAAGTVTISATQPGNNYFTAATPVSYVLTISKASQKMSFGTLASKTFGDASFAILANATSGLPINLVSTDNSIISLAGNIATINGGGTCSIKAFQVGNNNYLASDTISQTITIAKKTQSITMDSIAIVAFGAYDIVPTVKTESNGTVNLSSNNSAVATIVNGKIHIVGVGTATITATQIGTNNFLSATTSRIIKVGKNQQSITFATPNIKSFSDSSFVLDGISSSGLPISYTSSNSAIATISNDTVVILSSGKVTITAKQAGNASFEAATDVLRTLSILPSDQYITFNSIDTVSFGQTSQIIPVAIASSELPVSLTSYNLSVAKIINGKIEIVGAGSSIILATQIGNTNYNQAASIKQLLVVKKATQILTVSPIASLVYGASNVSVTASSTSGLAISIASSDPSVILVQNNMLYAVQQGSATITITQAGNDNYEPVSKTQNVTVNPSAQTITFTNIPSKTYGDANFALIANSTSSLGINYVSSNNAILSIAGNIATINGAGSVTIKASQNGNSNYAKADTVSLSITIAKKTQSIIMDSIPALLFGASDISPTVKTESNGIVNLSSNNLTVATIVNGKIHIVGVGIATVTATQNGTDNYLPVATSRIVKVGKNQQSISFATPSIKSFNDSSFVLDGASSSGLPISYTSSNSAIATINNDTVVLLSSGKVTITAMQAGNADYEAASSVIRTLTIMPADQSIVFDALDTITFGSVSEIAPTVSSTSGLPVSLTSFNLSVAKIVNGKIVIVGAGSTVISASQNGNLNYNQAAPVKQVLVVNEQLQTLKISPISSLVYGMTNVEVKAEASSKLPISISTSSPNIIQIVNNKLNVIGTGLAFIHVSQKGTSGIAAIDSVIQINVTKANQTIAFPSIPIKKVGTIPFKLFATSNSGYPVMYKSSNPDVADVVENEVTIVGTGACKITAYVDESEFYFAGDSIQTIIVTALNTLKMPMYTINRDTVINLNDLVLSTDTFTYKFVSGKKIKATINDSLAHIIINNDNKAWIGTDTLWFTAVNKNVIGDVQTLGIKIRRRPLAEQIAMVTVDSATATKCIVAWERSLHAGIKGYIIYRGGIEKNKWDSIGYVSADSSSYFVDKAVNVKQQAYQYMLVTVDSNDVHSAPSSVHTTMHLLSGLNTDKQIQLWWTPYVGADVKSYIIYRLNQATGVYDSIGSSSLVSFTDIYTPTGKLSYKVGIRFAKTVRTDSFKSDNGPFSVSLSNMAESELVGAEIEEMSQINVYPNPAQTHVSISSNGFEMDEIEILDVLGNCVYKSNGFEHKNSIEISIEEFTSGIYTVRINTNDSVKTTMFIKD